MNFIMWFNVAIKFIFFAMLFDAVNNNNDTSMMVVLCISFYYIVGMCYSFFVSKEKYYCLYRNIPKKYMVFDLGGGVAIAISLINNSYIIIGCAFMLLTFTTHAYYWYGYRKYQMTIHGMTTTRKF